MFVRWDCTGTRAFVSDLSRLGKAFDKIEQKKLFQSLERLNIPPEIMDAPKSLYRMPLFQVKHQMQSSQKFLQRMGIRQGSPLNPYLFILTILIIFIDMKDKFNNPRQRSAKLYKASSFKSFCMRMIRS